MATSLENSSFYSLDSGHLGTCFVVILFLFTKMAASLENSEFYSLDSGHLGTCFIVNNLDSEQPATRHDVDRISATMKTIGFDVEIHRNLTRAEMKSLEDRLFADEEYQDASSTVLFIISHGKMERGESFIRSTDRKNAWSVDKLVDKYSGVKTLHGKPKLIFIEACRGSTSDYGVFLDKTFPSPGDPSSSAAVMHVKIPSKQDVFIGFATSPGFVSWTQGDGSPYVTYLTEELAKGYKTLHLTDIHLKTRRRLADAQIGQFKQGAEERTTLLKKVAFYRYTNQRRGKIYDYSCNPQVIYIGNAYNIFEDKIGEARILKSCPTDKKIPDYVKIARVKQEKSIMKLFTSHEDYVKFRLEAMSVTIAPNPVLFTPETKPGYNVVPPVSDESRTFLTHIKQDIRFEISLKKSELKLENLDPHFIEDVKKLPRHNQEQNAEALLENKQIQNFITKYELHFVATGKSGGSLITKILTKKKQLSQQKIQQFQQEIKDTKSRSLLSRPAEVRWFSPTSWFSPTKDQEDQEVEAKFSVGDNIVMAENLEQMTSKKKDYIENLISSSPSPLASEVSVLPTHLAVSLVDPEKGNMMERCTELAITRGVAWRTLTYPNGGSYTGQLVSGKPHGHGELVRKDGRRYHGEWREGVWEGFGEHRWTDGAVFLGQYKCGEKVEGVYMWSSGGVYEGQFYKSNRHGWGTMYYSGGERWEGQWADDKRNGRGTLTRPDGSKTEGTWRDGKQI